MFCFLQYEKFLQFKNFMFLLSISRFLFLCVSAVSKSTNYASPLASSACHFTRQTYEAFKKFHLSSRPLPLPLMMSFSNLNLNGLIMRVWNRVVPPALFWAPLSLTSCRSTSHRSDPAATNPSSFPVIPPATNLPLVTLTEPTTTTTIISKLLSFSQASFAQVIL